jgi:hypothetical protein
MVRVGRFLRINCHAGLPGTLARLERHMEIESLKEQFSGAGFYYLDFGGRGVSLWRWEFEFHSSLRREGSTDRGQSDAGLFKKQRYCVGHNPKRKGSKDECESLGALG